ncbi:MAG: hypothetical protein A4S14_09995 [Proteobacteria bacterium SG_bin9]|nr:MAG: hypothetical protein A4S14_09995 [Proteobacteria bacterium SG_bin9]
MNLRFAWRNFCNAHKIAKNACSVGVREILHSPDGGAGDTKSQKTHRADRVGARRANDLTHPVASGIFQGFQSGAACEFCGFIPLAIHA